MNWKQPKIIAVDLKLIYDASTRTEAEQALDDFAIKGNMGEWSGALDHQPLLASELGTIMHVLRLFGRDTQDHLHRQSD